MKKLSASLLLVILAAGVCYGQKKLHGKFYMIYTIGCYHQLRFNGSTFKSKENCDGPGYQWGRGTYRYNLVDSSLEFYYEYIPHDTTKFNIEYSSSTKDSNTVEISVIDMDTKETFPWTVVRLPLNQIGISTDLNDKTTLTMPKNMMSDTLIVLPPYLPTSSIMINFNKGNLVKAVLEIKRNKNHYTPPSTETFHVKKLSRKRIVLVYPDGYAETLVRYRLYRKFHRKVRRHDKHQPDN